MKYFRQFPLLIFLASILHAGDIPQIYHRVPDKFYYDQFDWIHCVVDPGSYQLIDVGIFIKDDIKNLYTEYPMINDNGVYTFQLIPEMVQTDSFIYFITAEFSGFSLLAYPEENPKTNPVIVPIVQEKRSAKVIAVQDVVKLFCDLGRNIDNVQNITIFTRYGQTGRFNPEPMVFNKGRFQYTLRESSDKNSKLFYYIVILFDDQTTLSYPSDEFDKNMDYRILNGRRS
ncbi:hypothetical protein KJ762_05430 [bacterium]|nr:hypothetical protein [bacterium]MBU1065940.1 hypothetical protein [bacterium]MBU1633937.1 hypothetical protein [bacterium]MBU1873839.1 hypothetical protein [bacterium]